MFCHVLFYVLICFSSLKAAPSPPPSPSPSPPPRSEGQNDTEQPPLPPLLSSLYPIPIPYSPSSPTASPPPPTARDVSPPIQYVSRNVLPLIERRPTVRVLPFRQTPPSPPLPWETPRPTPVDHENRAVWEGAHGGKFCSPPTPTAHPSFTNGDRPQCSVIGRPGTPPDELEARELEAAYWDEVEAAAQTATEQEFWRGTPENNPSPEIEQRPLNEVNQEWEDNVEVNPGWEDNVNQEWNCCDKATSSYISP
jgi:hypothetical protein